MYHRECIRCRFTLPIEDFPAISGGDSWMCNDCWSVHPVVEHVAHVAADALARLVAIDALLYMGYYRAARLIARGATYWPLPRELREGTGMPRQPLWWISLDADTTALFRMLLRRPHQKRTPIVIPAA